MVLHIFLVIVMITGTIYCLSATALFSYNLFEAIKHQDWDTSMLASFLSLGFLILSFTPFVLWWTYG